jgi:hypothetical protein
MRCGSPFPNALEQDSHIWVIGTQRHSSRVLEYEEGTLADKGDFESYELATAPMAARALSLL